MVEPNPVFNLDPSVMLNILFERRDDIDPERLHRIEIADIEKPDIPLMKILKLICTLCKGLVVNPIKDESCEELFCSFCITNALKLSKKCPGEECKEDF